MNCGIKIMKEEFGPRDPIPAIWSKKKKKKEREMESKQSVLFSQVLRQYGVVESTRLSK